MILMSMTVNSREIDRFVHNIVVFYGGIFRTYIVLLFISGARNFLFVDRFPIALPINYDLLLLQNTPL